MKNLLLLILGLMLSLGLSAQSYELPNDTIGMIKHSKYSFKYSEKHEQPLWEVLVYL